METTDLKTLYMSNLKAVKDSLDKSVAKMANDLNMSASTINSYIQGERTVSLEILTRLYKTYNVNANWFCTGEGEMFINPPQSPQDKAELAETVKKVLIETLMEYGGDELIKKILK